MAQSAAGLHALKHLRLGSDSPGVPDAQSQLCLACASFAPLASTHGGSVTSFTVASPGVTEFVRVSERVVPRRRQHFSFRSRAPPR
jgi:hypothetical protein